MATFQDKVVIITGAESGMGRAMTNLLLLSDESRSINGAVINADAGRSCV